MVSGLLRSTLRMFARPQSDPEGVQVHRAFESRNEWYRLLWEYYRNSTFEDGLVWDNYINRYRLYKGVRSIYNPTRRLVDFYAGSIYPGVLTINTDDLPDAVPTAIPLALPGEEEPDPENPLRQAIGQLWQWSNWQSGKSVMVRFGAALGDVLIEVVDDMEREKVTFNIVWPGHVAELRLDATGNVKLYALEYPTYEEDGTAFIFKKRISPDLIEYFKDGQPWDPDGEGAVRPNPYEFVPAVWCRHRDIGGDHGTPAMGDSLGKVDELNSLWTHVNDQMHKVIGAPLVFWADGSMKSLSRMDRSRATDSGDRDPYFPEQNRENITVIKGPSGGKLEHMSGNLPLGDALSWANALIGEIENDHPELVLYKELRAMSQVTGPAAMRLMGDVVGPYYEAAANYDQQSVKLFQMGVAIAGERQRTSWRQGSDAQAVFAPFSLESYAAGDLNFSIAPRPLIPMTALEALEIERQRRSVELEASGGFPVAELVNQAAGA